MSRLIYVVFSGADYERTTALIVADAPRFGADEVLVYDDEWLRGHEFFRLNAWLWRTPTQRGFGWMAWKPLIVFDAMDRCAVGDVVLYVDADCAPIAPLGVVRDVAAREGAMLFMAGGHDNARWCKKDCLIAMGQDEPKYLHAQHGCGRFAAFCKGPWKPKQFLMEWLTYSVNPYANTFDPSRYGEDDPSFTEHRMEQAILTNLAHKYGYKLYREACEAGNWHEQDRDLYPQLFRQENQTHGNNPGGGSRFKNV